MLEEVKAAFRPSFLAAHRLTYQGDPLKPPKSTVTPRIESKAAHRRISGAP
jgi:hypothetical protein